MPENNNDQQKQSWHATEVEEVISSLQTDTEKGLTHDEAENRLHQYGTNELPSGEQQSNFKRFLKQFQNVLIYILLIAALFTAFLQEWIDMAVILGVVLINAAVGYIQEGKAERAMESIRGMLSPKATVIRDGKQHEIDAVNLVPGDIVLLTSGNRVPADIRIIHAQNAQADESVLTGEAEPVSKQSEPVEEDAPLGDRKSMAYSSAIVTSGRIRGIVAATGPKAEIGRISEMVSQVEQLQTPLLRRIDHFGKLLSIAIVALSALIFVIGYFLRNLPAVDTFMAVVSLAVAAIPEGLPAIMTITLALGVQKMAKRNAIIRKLPAVETLGSVTVICADKTGTLTRNEMTVTSVALADKIISVSGVGYEPKGQFSIDDQQTKPDENPGLMRLARAGMLCSEAKLKNQDDNWTIQGTPTEGSIIVLAHKAGLDQQQLFEEYERLDLIPFESERKFMASLHKTPENENVAYIKGAPERVLEMCSEQLTQQGQTDLDRDKWMQIQEKLADQGNRVLAIAEKKDQTDKFQSDQLDGLTMLGFVGIMDPPRDEAIYAVEQCHNAGINVKMITGDHVLTARSIGKQMNIGDGEHAIEGKQLEKADKDELIRLVHENDVFARSSPEHKLKIMEALQGENQIVAMTGDGVNDAPALKRADVGVAMGIKGSEAAKEAAEIVLADDNFATIERAVEEGRTIYDNLVKTILYLLPTNGAQSLVVISSVLFLFDTMATTPVQILWINMVTAVTLALSLAFELPEENIMQRPPRPPQQPIITKFLVWRIILVSILIAAAAIIMFLRYLNLVAIEQARTIAVNTIVSGQVFYLFSSRFLENSSFTIKGIIGNKKALIAIAILILLQAIFTYWPPAQTLFGTAAITLAQWLWILLAGVIIFILIELEKLVFRKWRSRKQQERSTE